MFNNYTNINKTDNHLWPQIMQHKRTTKHNMGNPGPGLEQTQSRVGVKQVKGTHMSDLRN